MNGLIVLVPLVVGWVGAVAAKVRYVETRHVRAHGGEVPEQNP